jgi:hypothetical protein
MSPRSGLCFATAVIALAAAGLSAASQADAETAQPRRITSHHVISYQPAPRLGGASPALAGGLPTFTASVTDGTSKFTYTMVGKNPSVATTAPSTTVQAEIVPLKMVIRGETFDPTVGNTCDSVSALSRTTNSPVFKASAWKFGATSIGTAQYVDAFRRAEFWNSTNPSGVNPGYHVKLNPTVLAPVTIKVPDTQSTGGAGTCGDLGAVEVNWLDNYLRTKVIPGLSGVKPSTFPFFVVGNVVEFEVVNQQLQCCILGFHNAMSTSKGVQTYGIADYENSGFFAPSENVKDIATASHEVAEWMDDPTGTNPTKKWGHIGQVANCQRKLEVGDPLSGTVITRTVGTMHYHVQELAFFSWFYHSRPSLGANGWFSNNGTFTTSAAACS